MNHPLAGKHIVITRPEAQAQEFVDLLRQAGALPVMFPTIQIAPLADSSQLDAVLGKVDNYDWVVFTSANGVRFVCDRLQTLGQSLSVLSACQIAVIGPATAATLSHYGLQAALQPDEYIAESIFESLAQQGSLTGKRFLLLRADIARTTLRQQLIAAGAIVDEIPVYRTIRGEPDPTAYTQLRAGVDIITFTSSSTVRFFFELLGAEADTIAANVLIACIGPITAQTARSFGLNVGIVAEEYTVTGLMAALAEG